MATKGDARTQKSGLNLSKLILRKSKKIELSAVYYKILRRALSDFLSTFPDFQVLNIDSSGTGFQDHRFLRLWLEV